MGPEPPGNPADGGGTPRAELVPPPRRGLLERDLTRVLVALLTFLAAVAALWVAWQIVSPILRTVMLFTLSAVLAFILAAPVDALTSRFGHRTAAIVAVYLTVGLVVVGGLGLLAGPFIAQATALAADLPRYAAELEARAPDVEDTLGRYGVTTSLEELKARVAQSVEEGGVDVLQHLVGTLAEVGGLLVDALLALVISLYLLLDGPGLRRRVLGAIPNPHRDKALFLEGQVTRVLGGYLRGQLILAVTIGVVAGLGCWLLGLPYAVVLGVLAGLFELVPMFGPILSAVPALLVALFQPFPTVLWILFFFVVIQQIENNVLVPRISGHAVGLHPLGAMFALLTGFQLAGVLGALFAVPVAGIVWVLAGAAYRNAVAGPSHPRPRRLPRPMWHRREAVAGSGDEDHPQGPKVQSSP